DKKKETIKVTYDLADKERDDIKISLKTSFNRGYEFDDRSEAATGDVGYPIKPGKKKSITWSYKGVKYIPHGFGVEADDSKGIDLADFEIMLVADDQQKVDIQDIVDKVSATKLKEYMEQLVGERSYKTARGIKNIDKARELLKNHFKGNGLKAFRHPVEHGDYMGYNYSGVYEGTLDGDLTVIVSGHYDTVKDTPGADDNASGVAGLLEIARVISKYGFNYSMDFVAFDLEEENLLGSNLYVKSLWGNKNMWVKGIINMDMIGYYSDQPNSQTIPEGFESLFPDVVSQISESGYKANFIVETTNDFSKPLSDLFNASAKKYVPGLKTITLTAPDFGSDMESLRQSDHVSFWDRGYQAISLGDGGSTRSPHYHTQGDTIDKIDFDKMADVVKAALATIVTIAEPNNSHHVFARISNL
ncbi:MAG: M28 family peptidase, partial [Bacteroidota bacterium]